MKKSFRYQHIYSVVNDKAPSATTLLEGEIAVNAFADNEKLFIKNSSGDVVDFPRSYSIKDIDEDMEIIAAALNELNDRKLDASAYTPTKFVASGEVVETIEEPVMRFYNLSGQTLFELEIPSAIGADGKTIAISRNSQNKKELSSLIYLKDTTADDPETIPNNVKKRYRLVDVDGNNILTVSGNTSAAIDIYKDSSVVEAFIGTSGDSVDSGTGVVTKLAIGDSWTGATAGDVVSKADFHFLNYVYFDGGFSGATEEGDGTYKLINVDLGQATAGVYGSGVTMTTDGAVTGVVDSASSVVVTEYTDSGESATTEAVLTVGEDGFKVEHIQEAIDAKADIWRRLYHVTSGIARTDLVESATTLEYYNLSGDTLFQIELPIDNKLDSGSTNPVQNSAITKVIIDNERVVAAALNDLNDRKLDISAYTPTDISKLVASGVTVESASTIEYYNLSGDTLFNVNIPAGAVGDELTIHTEKDADNKNIISSLIYIKKIAEGDASLPANVKERYQLVDASGNTYTTASGATSVDIDIYKDSSIVEIYVGTSGDTIDEDTGVISKLAINDPWSGAVSGDIVTEEDFHFLNYAYYAGGFSGTTSGDGKYDLTMVDLGKIAVEVIYNSGVTVDEGVVRGVVDSASSVVVIEYNDDGTSATTDDVLTVGEDGFKVENIQEAIDAKADIFRRLYHVTSGAAKTDVVESATTLEYYNLSGETLFTIDLPVDSGLTSASTNPVQNSAITKVIVENERIVAAALNDLNDRKLDISAYTPTDVSKLVASGATIEAIPGDPSHSATTLDFYNLSGDTLFSVPFPEGADVDKDFDSGSTRALANSAITVTLEEMQKVTSSALNDLNLRKLDASAYTMGVYEDEFFVATEISANTEGVSIDFINISGETVHNNIIETDDVVDDTTSASTNPVQTQAVFNAMDGLKMKKVTQSEYDEMEQQGTLDQYTIYFIIEEE